MRVSLKDIALRCAVSPTVVSAVLNQKKGRIGCSSEKRKMIQDTAREMGYSPNLLARSMVNGHSSVVGVMLSIHTIGFSNGNYEYFNTVFLLLVKLLNQQGLEVLFAPFQTEEEQIEKLKQLIANGIVGGIITNLIPHHFGKIAEKLQHLSFPYMILGYPVGFDCHCVYTTSTYSLFRRYQENHGITETFLATKVSGNLYYYRLPFPEDYLWLAEPRVLTEEELRNPKLLVIASGIGVFKALPVRPKHLILIDLQSRRANLPPGIPAVLQDSDHHHVRLAHAATQIAAWMKTGKEPEVHRCPVKTNASYVFVNFAKKDMNQQQKG